MSQSDDSNDTTTDDAWADALAEQAGAEQADATDGPRAEALAEQAGAEQAEATDDPWAEALAEQRADGGDAGTAAGDAVFKPLQGEASGDAPRDLDMIMEIPVTLSVELGHTRLAIRELLDLAKGSIVELDGLAGEPMDILINGYLIAQGEVVVVEDKYGIRITEIVTRAERLHKLNR